MMMIVNTALPVVGIVTCFIGGDTKDVAKQGLCCYALCYGVMCARSVLQTWAQW